ncbi:MAG: hypothetical protein R3B57_05590 [Phycisphaerales bacterium]
MRDDPADIMATPDDPSLEREILIGRVIDGEASPEDWDALRALASSDPTLWNDLRWTQRQHELLATAVGGATACADHVDLDRALADPSPMVRRIELVGRYGGWLAAAAVALFWSLGINPLASGGGQSAGLGPIGVATPQGPDQALQNYLDAGRQAGRVIDEVPDRVVVQARPLDGGQRVEVLYLRQILEREVVDQVYGTTQDETGAQHTVPVRLVPPTQGSGVW